MFLIFTDYRLKGSTSAYIDKLALLYIMIKFEPVGSLVGEWLISWANTDSDYAFQPTDPTVGHQEKTSHASIVVRCARPETGRCREEVANDRTIVECSRVSGVIVSRLSCKLSLVPSLPVLRTGDVVIGYGCTKGRNARLSKKEERKHGKWFITVGEKTLVY